MKKIAFEMANVLAFREVSVAGLVSISIAIGLLAAALIPVSVH